MHIPTLYIVFAGVLMVSSIALIIAWWENPHGEGQKSWALGACAGALSTLAFSATALSTSLYWLNAFVNPIAWLAVALFARGARQYARAGSTPMWMWLFLGLASLVPLIATAALEQPRGATLCVGSLVAAVFCFDLVYVFSVRLQRRSPASFFLVFFFGLWGATHVLRILLTVGDLSLPTYTRSIDQFMVLVGTLGAAASAMGFAMLTTRALRDARAKSFEELERSVEHLREQFAALATGDYAARAKSFGTSQHMDEIARLFNETADQIGLTISEMENQRGQLVATQESLLDGLLVLGRDLRVALANPAILQLLKKSESEVAGVHLSELLAGDDASFADELLATVTRGPIREQLVGFKIAGETLATLTVNVSAYRNKGGDIGGLVLSIRDDRPLREAQAQLQMTDRLAAMGTVAAGVAHEINNPLSFVASNIEYVTEELQEYDGKLETDVLLEVVSALEAAYSGSERIRKIVQDLKRFTRSSEEKVELVDVNQLVRSAAAMLENEVRHHARVELELGDVSSVRGNDAKLGQVFLNLIHNAAQAIPPGHASENLISVTVSEDARGIVVEVRDTGQGISPENIKRIFEAFYTTKPVGVGTGLGLAICHRVVTDAGGAIEVESEEGKGTLFRVILPPSKETTAAEPSNRIVAETAVERRRVLVIDDEIEVGRAAKRLLSKMHDVDTVSAANEGLERLADGDYDVILCDLMMPEMTGMELYDRIRHSRPELMERMVFMSGGVFSAEAEAFLRDPQLRVIAKPLDSRSLRGVVANSKK